MGYEKTLPSNHLIALFTVLSVVTLGGLHFLFDSYFTRVTTNEVNDKILTVEPVKLTRLRIDETTRLKAANIEASKRAIAGGNRPASITPQIGVDLEARLAQLGALAGWSEDSRPLALAVASRDEARGYLEQMRASVEEAREAGNQEALDTLLPRLQTAEEAYERLERETQQMLDNQVEAGVGETVANPQVGAGEIDETLDSADTDSDRAAEQPEGTKPAPQQQPTPEIDDQAGEAP